MALLIIVMIVAGLAGSGKSWLVARMLATFPDAHAVDEGFVLELARRDRKHRQ